jgi:hypothetical protein
MAGVSVALAIDRVAKELDALFEAPITRCLLDAMGPFSRPLSVPVEPNIVEAAVMHAISRITGVNGRSDDTERSAAVNRIFRWVASARRMAIACRIRRGGGDDDDGGISAMFTTFMWTFRAEITKGILFSEHVIHVAHAVRIFGKRTLEVHTLKKMMIALEPDFAVMDAYEKDVT